MTFLKAGRKLYVPGKHLWLRATKQNVPAANTLQKSPWLVDVGLSVRGLEDIGDVSEMRSTYATTKSNKSTEEWNAKAGDDLLIIDWDAHKITSADELYHTVWETFSETTYIQSPISGVIQDVHLLSPDEEELDEDTVLLRILATCETLQQSMDDLLEEEDYEELVEKNESPGMFSA